MTNSTQFSALICATLGAFFIVSCAAKKPAPDPIQNLKATEVSEALKKDDTIVVLDIRTPAEYAEGHLAGAKNIDFKAEDFEAKIGELDSGKAYVVHCKSGGRSSLSSRTRRFVEAGAGGGRRHGPAARGRRRPPRHASTRRQ